MSLEPGTDRMGGDYKHYVMVEGSQYPEVCQTACANDKECKSYSYVKAGIKGPAPVCFLKSSVVPAKADPCCTSGVKSAWKMVPDPAPPTGETVSYQPDSDRMGFDYKHFEMDQPTAALCQQACSVDSNCKAYSYVKPGIKGPKAMCFLKSQIVEATANTCCVSGTKGTPTLWGPKQQPAASPLALHHFYEKKKDFFHFYTTDVAEKLALQKQPTWKYVGVTAYVMSKPTADTVPLYQLWKSEFGGTNHLYTVDQQEATNATTMGWTMKNVVGHIAPKQIAGTVPLYRLYLPCQKPAGGGAFEAPCENATGGDVHYLTADEVDKNKAVFNGMQFIRIEGYVWKTKP